ncbi:MAG: LysR family transcriptional regulator [Paracoccaceae bacterium]|nr:LysR family transcriptional regulator [Paracoccaceae bacterium]
MAGADTTPRLWIKIYFGERGQLGPGKIRLLQAIDADRSIAAAARTMNMSYRRAWLLVDQMNQTFGQPVVATRTGGSARGGAELTALGREIVARYLALLDQAQGQSAEELAELADLIQPDD